MGASGDLFVYCRYAKAGVCLYSAEDGESDSGSSACPYSISAPSAGPGNSKSDSDKSGSNKQQQEPSQGTNQQIGGAVAGVVAAAAAAAAGSSKLAKCPPKDDVGSPLESESTVRMGVNGDLFVSCRYAKAGVCLYYAANGEADSGSSACPDSIAVSSTGSGSSKSGSNKQQQEPSQGTNQQQQERQRRERQQEWQQ
ncbi:hypothetical protein GGX14DRAFT_175062 [Mycena pura]|uniref:Uncharacterized protein n=1 Tax=Mycena pura TaxID=153505 RepID=A0AAD6YKQ6_9AGAR|nr:hypothetical protein GGX14DRAFT_175062 [Mycena pura]